MAASLSVRMDYNLGAGLQKDSLHSVTINKWNEAYVKKWFRFWCTQWEAINDYETWHLWNRLLKPEILDNDNMRNCLEI